MINGNMRIKWAGPNTAYIETVDSDRRIYINKQELVDMLELGSVFIAEYPDSFSTDTIDCTDDDELI
jgi:hypothetical protein